ncbi:hypothetical protein HY025_03190 [Candidatus Daviesbacteria bacterium]|nr:hypothetical protein [Candidatus Daviesbacteria bacterium]
MAKRNLNKLAIGAAAGIVLAGAAAAAGAALSNKKVRDALNKKAQEALKVVSRMALEVEKGAEGSLKVLESKTKQIAEKSNSSKPKKSSKKR